MSLSRKLKELRIQRGWTQQEVAKLSGLDRRYISYLEQPQSKGRPSADAFLKLARAFNIKPEELYQAAGYITEPEELQPRPETPEEILARLESVSPRSIPVFIHYPFHAGEGVRPYEYIYRAKHKSGDRKIEGYLVYGSCLEPQVGDGDIIIVERGGVVVNGDLVACLVDNKLLVARLRKVADELWMETNEGKFRFEDCQETAPVIEIRRRLK